MRPTRCFFATKVRLPFALAACFAATAHAQSTNLSGTAALSSQLVDRGIAITPVTPIFQAAGSWTTPSGWSLGVSGGTELRSPGHLVEGLAQLSRYWSLSNAWQMQTALAYYDYPGSDHYRYFDRTEASVTWIYRDVLTLGLSGISLINGSEHNPRGAADVNVRWPLGWHFSVSAGVGVAQSLISPYGSYGYGRAAYYRYGQAGLRWSYGAWRVELDRVATDPDTHRQWGSLVAAPWVATIAWSF